MNVVLAVKKLIITLIPFSRKNGFPTQLFSSPPGPNANSWAMTKKEL